MFLFHLGHTHLGNTLKGLYGSKSRLLLKRKGSPSSLDRPINIGDDCWLGVNVVICPGVSIDKGSVIGANSVVIENVPENSVVAGVSTKVIGGRFQ
jgi:acetyltransferase-like isoleucine patch superfamily enzyme